MVYIPTYTKESPFFFTKIINRFLTYYVHRSVPPHRLDALIILNDGRYVNRPDLLAIDLYGNEDLFWIIPVRNGLQDPVFDLKLGETFVVPHPSFVQELI